MSDELSSRLQRLRKAGKLHRRSPRQVAESTEPMVIPGPRSEASGCLADLPGMEEREGLGGRYLLRTVRFPLTHRQGQVVLGALLQRYPRLPAWLLDGDELDVRRAVFLDTETSGLAGGTGTIVFLTGVGTFEGGAYVVRQFFARNPAEERAYLPHLAQLLAERQGLITFNGRSFDWPLLRSRFILSGVEPPKVHPHADLLIPARRVWKSRLGGCRFLHLERRIVGHERQGLDVPSWMIPSLWFRFARGEGRVEEMEGVLYHNLEDLVSMVPLAYHLAATMTGDEVAHPHDWLALARLYARGGDEERAEMAYRRALDHPLPAALRAQAMRELALLLKRADRREEAAIWWEALARWQPMEVDALVELAKYYEWHVRDWERALRMTQEAMERAGKEPSPLRRKEMLDALRHRLARLRRKLARAASEDPSVV